MIIPKNFQIQPLIKPKKSLFSNPPKSNQNPSNPSPSPQTHKPAPNPSLSPLNNSNPKSQQVI